MLRAPLPNNVACLGVSRRGEPTKETSDAVDHPPGGDGRFPGTVSASTMHGTLLRSPLCFSSVSQRICARSDAPETERVTCWQDLFEQWRCCHFCRRGFGRILDGMTVLIVLLATLAMLTVAAALNMTPDTHREVCQHGDFKF
jgi:hypothetical protein